MRTLIVIPARYGSTRLPGKPLVKIAGRTMLDRVVTTARRVAEAVADTTLVVATDDERIVKHCGELGVSAVMTPVSCPTGTDRAFAALQAVSESYDFVLNLQGDTPLTPSTFLVAMIRAFSSDRHVDVVTPVVRASWDELDTMREAKHTTPFSGTTAVVDKCGRALWFSKNILPAIRNEKELRLQGGISPVFRHIGLYGYRADFLETYVSLPQGVYEQLEGLEQLRVLENGYSIRAVTVDYGGRPGMSGVDSPIDVERAEKLLAEYGEPA